MSMETLHKHHIVPKYKCIELGLTTSYKINNKEFYFKENMVEVPREQHAFIHWGYGHKDLKPLLEVCNPPQWVIDMIPLGDNRDIGAAGIIAEGEIEQIDISGENHPNWQGGIAAKKIIFNRVYKEVSRFIVYYPEDMPLWDEDYVRELEHLRCIKETKRLIADGYEGRKRGERIQAYCLC